VITGLCEVTLRARDIRVLERFYADALGLDVISRDEDRIWLAVGERGRLGIWTPGRKEFGDEGGAHVHFAMAVEPRSLETKAERLRERGIDVEGPVEHPGGDRSIYFRDPEGNVAELWDFFEAQTVAELAS
jgi:catechol-2,3-dioxygenase